MSANLRKANGGQAPGSVSHGAQIHMQTHTPASGGLGVFGGKSSSYHLEESGKADNVLAITGRR